ncbi:MAG: hypothetical protein FWD06_06130 [Oscillospiraceae bacterium]|nr:hypothetical protein [Oscillospiraceae bacterium]
MEFIVSILLLLFYLAISVLTVVIPIALSLMASAGWIYFLYRIIYWAINR